MKLQSWLHALRSARPKRSRKRRRISRRHAAQPRIEKLEDRALLSGVNGWAFEVGGSSASGAYRSVNVDSDGNVYLLTLFRGTVDFDPGPGTYELTARDPGTTAGDGAVAKYTSAGELLWATRFGGDNGERVDDMELDAAGNIYITGVAYATPSIDFGSITVGHSGKGDAFVAKLNNDGEFQWAHSYGGPGNERGWDLSLNAAGDVFAAGRFYDQIDIDPDPVDETILTSAGGSDAVVWKLDTDGDFQWARQFGSPANDEAFRVATDATGDVYVTGPFRGTVNFGSTSSPLELTSATSDVPDTYLVKLDSLGDTTWARHVSGPGHVGHARLTVAADGSVFTAGSFDQTAEFVGQGTTLTSTALKDAYIARWDADGSLEWTAQMNGSDDVLLQRLTTDADNNIYAAGRFKGTTDFDPAMGTSFDLSAANSLFDGVLVKLDENGAFQTAYHATGADHVRTADVAVADNGDLLVVGSFENSVTLPTGDVLTGSGLDDTWVNKLQLSPGISVSPTSGLVTTESGGTASFDVVLTAAPDADVSIPVSSSDSSEGTVSVSSLTFTPTNWATPQTVTVTGVDDSDVDGTVDYSIVLGPASSADSGYDGLDADDVQVSNEDDDALDLTKFYVVDTSADDTFEYDADGNAVESYGLTSGNSAPRGTAASPDGSMIFVIDDDDYVYVYDPAGNALGQWKANGLSRPEGIATDGVDLWIADRGTDRIYHFAGGASRLSGSASATSNFKLNSGNKNPRGLTTDGVHLWVVNGGRTDKVFKYTVGGSFLGSWNIDSANYNPQGITIDPANVDHIWIVDASRDRVYQYSGAAGRTSGGQSADASFALSAGNTNPRGIADPPPANLERDGDAVAPAAKTLEAGDRKLPNLEAVISPQATRFPGFDKGRSKAEPAEIAAESVAYFQTALTDADDDKRSAGSPEDELAKSASNFDFESENDEKTDLLFAAFDADLADALLAVN